MNTFINLLQPFFLLASVISVFHNNRTIKPIQTFYEVTYFSWILIVYQLVLFLDFSRIIPDQTLILLRILELLVFFFILKYFLRLIKLSLKPSALLLGILFSGLIPFLILIPEPLRSLMLPGILLFCAFLFFFAYQYNPSFALKKTCFYLVPALFLTALGFTLKSIPDPWGNILSTGIFFLLFHACYFTNLFLHKIAFESRLFSFKNLIFRLLSALIIYALLFYFTTYINPALNPVFIKILALTASLFPLSWELTAPFLERKIFSMLFPSLGDYFSRLEICRTHLKTLLKIEDFYRFVTALFKEFFTIEEFFLVVLDSRRENIRCLDASGEKNFKLEADIKILEDFFSTHTCFDTEKENFQDDQIPEILKRLTGRSNEIACIKLGKKITSPFCLAVLLKPKKLSGWELEQIQIHSDIFLEGLNRVFMYEQKKREMMTRIHETEEDFDTSVLASENIELQKSYEKIKTLQSDLLSKERKAALTKFSISLDDEISTPLSNMVMGVEYQLEKLKSGKQMKQEDLIKLLQIIITQSLRIKKILEELRQVSTHYTTP